MSVDNLLPAAVRRLVTGPVLKTRAGCRARLACMTLGQQWMLAYHLDCRVEKLDRVLHDRNHKKRMGRTPAGGSDLPEPREGLFERSDKP
jgi:hypothetical protein